MANFVWITNARLRLVAVVALVGLVIGVNPAWSNQYTVRIHPLAFGGDVAPGVAGATYDVYTRWDRSSRDGRITWQAELSNGQEGIWVNDDQGTRLLALAGQDATYRGIYDQPSGFINSNGNTVVVVTQDTDDGHLDPQDIIVTDGVTERVVYRAGQQAPGLSRGITLAPSSFGILINDSDILSMKRFLKGSGINTSNDSAHWIGLPENLQLLIREGDPAPGLPGQFIGDAASSRVKINSMGVAAITQRFSGSALGKTVWTGTPGNLELVASHGLPAPGTNGLVLSSVGPASITEAKELVFNVNFDDPTTGLPSGTGLYKGSRDELSLLLGPEIPSPFDGDEIVELGWPSINRTGDATMRAVLSNILGEERQAIIKVDLNDPTQSVIIAAVGDSAPGSDSTFTQVTGVGQINDRGDVLLFGKLSGFGSANIGHGLWMKPTDGPLQLVAREGQTISFQTNDGLVTREIAHVGLPTILSDEASLAVHIRFTDNTYSGLFVAQLAVVPEPCGITLAIGAVIALGGCRWPNRIRRMPAAC